MLSPSPLKPLSERGILTVLILTILLNGLIAIRDRNYAPRIAEVTASILLSLSALSGARNRDL